MWRADTELFFYAATLEMRWNLSFSISLNRWMQFELLWVKTSR
jgi:hypothetical protein